MINYTRTLVIRLEQSKKENLAVLNRPHSSEATKLLGLLGRWAAGRAPGGSAGPPGEMQDAPDREMANSAGR